VSPHEGDDREFGDILARVRTLEAEVTQLRNKSHKQAQAVQANSLYVAAMKSLPNRVEKLERWRSFEMGVAAIVGGLLSFGMQYLVRRI